MAFEEIVDTQKWLDGSSYQSRNVGGGKPLIIREAGFISPDE